MMERTTDDGTTEPVHGARSFPPRFVFLDLETTGLESGTDQITEAAWIFEDADGELVERQIFVEHDRLPNDWVIEHTDYVERILRAPKRRLDDLLYFLRLDCETLTAEGKLPYLVGACPAFDDRFLRHAYGRYPHLPLPYHYHVLDVEAMAIGALGLPEPPALKDIRSMLGIPGENEAAHTALSDAREVKLIFDAIRAR